MANNNNNTMQNTIATATATQKQSILAVSDSLKAFFNECRATFGAAGKSKEYVAATEKEIGDAMLEFVNLHRFEETVETVEQPMTDAEGNPMLDDKGEPIMESVETLVEVDRFKLEVDRTLALRATTSRANSNGAKLAAKEKELEELKALLASLQAKQG